MLRIYRAAALAVLLAFAGAEVQARENQISFPPNDCIDLEIPIPQASVNFALNVAASAWSKAPEDLKMAYDIGWVTVTRVYQNGVAYLKVSYAGLELLVLEPI